MSLLQKIRRHAAVASGNFHSMFKKMEIPPPPAAVTSLLQEINQTEPDIDRLGKVISSSPAIAAHVIKTANSSLYSPRMPIIDVKRAITLLGLANIRSMALAWATMNSLPKPDSDFFNQEAFWIDSLLRAMIARQFAKKSFPDQVDDVFTAALLADLALPFLLCFWREYYQPVIEEWKQYPKRLSEIERSHFGWDHAQAGAWIIQNWGFPEEIVCYLGAHNLSIEEIAANQLGDTILVPMAVATLSPSVLKPDFRRAFQIFQAANESLSMDNTEIIKSLVHVKDQHAEIVSLFGLPDLNAGRLIDDLIIMAENGGFMEGQ